MKTKGRAKAVWNTDAQLDTQSWAKMVNWEDILPFINLAGEYPKGTPTTNRSLNFHSRLNNIAEQIQVENKVRFRTMSEIFRIALHIGMQVLYHIFCLKKDLLKNGRGYFFYLELEKAHRLFERAKMGEDLERYTDQLLEDVRKGSTTKEKARAAWREMFSAVPDVDKPHIAALFNPAVEGNFISEKPVTRNFFGDLIKLEDLTTSPPPNQDTGEPENFTTSQPQLP